MGIEPAFRLIQAAFNRVVLEGWRIGGSWHRIVSLSRQARLTLESNTVLLEALPGGGIKRMLGGHWSPLYRAEVEGKEHELTCLQILP